jgi:hypothetical protein
MIHCPFCKAEMQTNPFMVAVCPGCQSKWKTSFAENAAHRPSEIDSFFHDRTMGSPSAVLHPVGTKVCSHCGENFPENLSCCPDLVKLTVDLLCAPPEGRGPGTDAKALQFLMDHRDVLEYHLHYVAKHGTEEEKDAIRNSNVCQSLGIAHAPV